MAVALNVAFVAVLISAACFSLAFYATGCAIWLYRWVSE